MNFSELTYSTRLDLGCLCKVSSCTKLIITRISEYRVIKNRRHTKMAEDIRRRTGRANKTKHPNWFSRQTSSTACGGFQLTWFLGIPETSS
jgi:hypothetical protein